MHISFPQSWVYRLPEHVFFIKHILWTVWAIFVVWLWYVHVFVFMYECTVQLSEGNIRCLPQSFFEIRSLTELWNHQMVGPASQKLQGSHCLYTLPRLRLKGASHQPQPFRGCWGWTLVLHGQQIIYQLGNLPGFRFNILNTVGWTERINQDTIQVLNFIKYLI